MSILFITFVSYKIILLMKIEPTYVTFEQAKLLKENGFNERTTSYWDKRDGLEEGGMRFPINHNERGEWATSRPEQWQVVEWLLDCHHIHIQVYPLHDDKWEWCIMFLNEPLEVGFKSSMSQFCVERSIFDSKQEAYSSAFDYILNNLI